MGSSLWMEQGEDQPARALGAGLGDAYSAILVEEAAQASALADELSVALRSQVPLWQRLAACVGRHLRLQAAEADWIELRVTAAAPDALRGLSADGHEWLVAVAAIRAASGLPRAVLTPGRSPGGGPSPDRIEGSGRRRAPASVGRELLLPAQLRRLAEEGALLEMGLVGLGVRRAWLACAGSDHVDLRLVVDGGSAVDLTVPVTSLNWCRRWIG